MIVVVVVVVVVANQNKNIDIAAGALSVVEQIFHNNVGYDDDDDTHNYDERFDIVVVERHCNIVVDDDYVVGYKDDCKDVGTGYVDND